MHSGLSVNTAAFSMTDCHFQDRVNTPNELPRRATTVQGALVDAMLQVSDPDAHGLRWLAPLRPQLAALQSCAPAERARREHAVRDVSVLALMARSLPAYELSSTALARIKTLAAASTAL
jgi:hypothetical protein